MNTGKSNMQIMDHPRAHGPMTPEAACEYLKNCHIRNLVFDVDDTLYYRSEPYFKAYHRVFPEGGMPDCGELFRVNAVVKEEEFVREMAGEISMREMQINRTKRTFAAFDVDISEETALRFENAYSEAQSEISPVPAFRAFLESIKTSQPERFLGIMTNGRHDRQWGKIRYLGLEKYVPRERIYVSEDGGVSKPDTEAFRNYERQTGVIPEETILIGDSIPSDVTGALAAGWHALWVKPET